jgi:regulator of nucleoside diphosphate kinase
MNKRQEVLNRYSLGLQMIQKNNKYSIIIKLKIMQQSNKQLVLLRDDYELLKSYLNGRHRKSAFDRRNAEELHSELKKARLVNKDAFPPDVVRLNSTVRIKTEGKDEITEWILVTPDEADIKERKISIMAPIGTALIGFRKGQKVKWKVPAGKKTFTIMDVINDFQ